MADNNVSGSGSAGRIKSSVGDRSASKTPSFIGVAGWHLPSAYYYATVTIELRISETSPNNVEVRLVDGYFRQNHMTNQGGDPWWFHGLRMSMNPFSISHQSGGSIQYNGSGLVQLSNSGWVQMDRSFHPNEYHKFVSNGWHLLGTYQQFNSLVNGKRLTLYVGGIVDFDQTPTSSIFINAYPLTLIGNWTFDYFPGETTDHTTSENGSSAFGDTSGISFNRKSNNSIDGDDGYFQRMNSSGAWADKKNKPNNYDESTVFICVSSGIAGDTSSNNWAVSEKSGREE